MCVGSGWCHCRCDRGTSHLSLIVQCANRGSMAQSRDTHAPHQFEISLMMRRRANVFWFIFVVIVRNWTCMLIEMRQDEMFEWGSNDATEEWRMNNEQLLATIIKLSMSYLKLAPSGDLLLFQGRIRSDSGAWTRLFLNFHKPAIRDPRPDFTTLVH